LTHPGAGRNRARLARLPWDGQAKKLEEAARHWASGAGANDEELAQDLERFGLPPDAFEGGAEPETCEVWPENWPAVELFLGCATQWRVDGMSGAVLGLDYQGVEALMRIRRVRDRAALFDDLQIME
ncbi:DUF1799 domain-containing protein, partial [Pelomicrobium sp. G1]|uniref:DUF1799 domain-containing protein n=1 Tax=Pelomicrobium sp. G1 TaxID=3452920 RepID=UPI003F76CE57